MLLGTLFFAASLTPSLLPRETLLQGALSGVSFAAGYGIGAFLSSLWSYLGLPRAAPTRRMLLVRLAALAAAMAVAAVFLWQASEGQNSIRLLMGLEPVETARPFSVASIAAAVFLIAILVYRAFALAFRAVARWLDRHVPPRLSRALTLVMMGALIWTVGNGVLLSSALRALDETYRQLDRLAEDAVAQPLDPLKTGSAASQIDWDELGRHGRRMVAAGPTRAEIEDFTGRPALEPLRVYVGLNSAETTEDRAALALAELRRQGAFDRSVLVILTPTGTGWVDQKSQRPLEYLLHGDVATVAVQYSYLPSWLALFVEPQYGLETAQAVFDAVYGHWTELPPDRRPRLYLHGISLGAMNSDLAADLFKIIGDPFHGAFWAGPPFPSRTWRQATEARQPGSPAWLPRFRDGSLIRFTAQENTLERGHAPWGAMRIVFLQYASDPVTFFEPQTIWRPPEWMSPPRGPDVSPRLDWYPVVTFLQLALDIATAVQAPLGHGHVYAAEHYIDGWRAILDPPEWDDDEIDRLKALFAGWRG